MVHGLSTESTRIMMGVLLNPGIRYLSTDPPGFKRIFPKFLTQEPMIHGISTESTRILKGIRIDQGIRYLSTDQPGFKRTYLKF